MDTIYYWLGFAVFWSWFAMIVIFGAISAISEYRERQALNQLRSNVRLN